MGLTYILFKARVKTFAYIQMDINNNICIVTDENPNEVKAWIEKNEKRKLDRHGYPVTAYSCSFPPSYIRPPPERDPVDKLVLWNASVIQGLDVLAWLNQHEHRLEYAKLLHKNVMEEVKKLMFQLFGK